MSDNYTKTITVKHVRDDVPGGSSAMSDDLVSEIRRGHVICTSAAGDTICGPCRKYWPCDAISAADEIERLREALKFYAAKTTYGGEYWAEIDNDIGDIARAALEPEKENAK